MGLSAGDLTFWRCPNPQHAAVRAEGNVQVCEVCGTTSEHTAELIERAQTEQRHRDVLILQSAARVPAGHNGPVPAVVFTAAATYLAKAPIGAPGGE